MMPVNHLQPDIIN